MDPIALIAVWALIIFLYLLPAWNAHRHHKKNAGAIAILNVLTGWTIVGWIVAMVWSATKD